MCSLANFVCHEQDVRMIVAAGADKVLSAGTRCFLQSSKGLATA